MCMYTTAVLARRMRRLLGGGDGSGTMSGPAPTGMHVHPAYRRHVNYQRGGGGGGSDELEALKKRIAELEAAEA